MAEPNSNLNTEFALRCGQDFVQNANKIIIKCERCGVELVEIWRTKPYVQVKTDVSVVCGLCNETSCYKQIGGGFHIGYIDGGKVVLTDMEPGDTTEDEKGNMVQQLKIITARVS